MISAALKRRGSPKNSYKNLLKIQTFKQNVKTISLEIYITLRLRYYGLTKEGR